MKNNIGQFTNCAYCGACMNVCPANAISVNSKGLYYSLNIDENKCVSCGKCIRVCPVNTPTAMQNIGGGYAGYVDDVKVLNNSSSGGMFYALSQLVLSYGGVVYGAAFSSDFRSVRFTSSDEVSIEYLQKSKYVESDVGFVFREIQNQLKNGRYVLFCGTPCQTAGLKRFLEHDYEKLLLVDFSCGGLPSHKMYEEYLDYLEKMKHSKVRWVDFRPKNYGWKWHSIYCIFQNGSRYTKLATLDPYYKSFLQGLSKRDYCYQCAFSDNHASDIILADFWNYKTIASDMYNRNRGLSLLITNSQKGEFYISQLRKSVDLRCLSLKEASYNIRKQSISIPFFEKHQCFCNQVEKRGFVNTSNQMIKYSIPVIFKEKCKELLFKRKYKATISDDVHKPQ